MVSCIGESAVDGIMLGVRLGGSSSSAEEVANWVVVSDRLVLEAGGVNLAADQLAIDSQQASHHHAAPTQTAFVGRSLLWFTNRSPSTEICGAAAYVCLDREI